MKLHHLRMILVIISAWILLHACTFTESDKSSSVNSFRGNEPTRIVVRILDLDSISITISTPTHSTDTSIPALTQQASASIMTPSNTASQPPDLIIPALLTATLAPPECLNRAEFIKHLSISNNTVLEAGQRFAKIWRIKNIGTCTWTTYYSLVFSSGESMGGHPEIPFPYEVKPGESLDLRLGLITPPDSKTYSGSWLLRDPKGNLFGVGEMNDQPLTVIINVKPTPMPVPG